MINKILSLLTIIAIGVVTGFSQTTMQPMTTQTPQKIVPLVAGVDFPLVTKANFKTRLPKNKQSKNKKAQEKYLEGEIAVENEDFKTAKAAFRQAIDLDIDFQPAHEQFITMSKFVKMQEAAPGILMPGQRNPTGLKTMAMPFGAGPAKEELLPFYQELATKYPKSASVQWALGELAMKFGDAQAISSAETAYRQALSINSKFAPAYQGLAMVSLFRKDQKSQSENLGLAYQYDNTVERAYQYANSLGPADEKKKTEIVNDILKRFPTSKEAFSIIMSMAYGASNDADKMKYFEILWRQFPNENTVNVMLGLQQLFNLWLTTKPDLALELAQDMVKRFPKAQYTNFNNWEELAEYQKIFVNAQKAVKAKKYDEAALMLKDVKAPLSSLDTTAFYVLKAQAEGKGETKTVYDILLKNAVGKYNVNFNKALYSFGSQVGKTQKQMDDEMWNLRVASAKVFKDFQLVRHDNNQPIKLSDLRGKVVFLSFWFPGCGPCIAEFPFLKVAKEKFGPRGFEMIFVNIVQKEDPQAIPVLSQHKMDVISLKIPEDKWAVKEYGVSGAPTNFLIDGEGRILFMPKVSSPGEVRDFEAQIEMLLERAKAGATANK